MLELQVPLLAAKALLLLLLFAFVYAVVRRGVGDLRSIPDDEPFRPGVPREAPAKRRGVSELMVEESEVLAPGTEFPIGNGTTTIGRSSASDIVLKSDDYVSGRHARLTRHGGLLYVEDLGSTNGTFVNGRKAVGATPLRDGDLVRVGSTTFRYLE
ncbi:FHA domain containing protein [Rubrobacter xylanophilus DSM 9941]|uniref:FHA domain containing protein n=1 Tax=Rubrobacter xylanophilus (strain DSM 9941 / JCM 11954 / NBRC 16129 / PRD-1) TaxID=266117 RepID=Q1B022_RUBXD|nr:FHA domain-containing protein [Rubrobacter xylanophilus]ABG03006.1 FHA domain containing protein [Rubrobacter xylanophilus DSM 9941]